MPEIGIIPQEPTFVTGRPPVRAPAAVEEQAERLGVASEAPAPGDLGDKFEKIAHSLADRLLRDIGRRSPKSGLPLVPTTDLARAFRDMTHALALLAHAEGVPGPVPSPDPDDEDGDAAG